MDIVYVGIAAAFFASLAWCVARGLDRVQTVRREKR